MQEARQFLAQEVDRLGAINAILSTNIRLRLDGNAISNAAQPQDRGVALYFTLKKRQISLACDRWDRVEDNVWAIAKHIEALRGQERWGVGSIEQAFRGYAALPGVGESEASKWWMILGVAVNASPDMVRDAYKILVKKHHPDKGGDPELFRRVQSAYDQFILLTKA
jgi:hypothetical protein